MSALPKLRTSPLEAMRAMSQAVVGDPDNAGYQIRFCNLVTQCTFNRVTDFTDTIKEAVRICLTSHNIRTIVLFEVWHSLLRLDESFLRLMTLTKENYLGDKPLQIKSDEYEFILSPFFLAGLKNLELAKIEYEYLLTCLRRYFLISDNYDEDKFVPFFCALAEQCNLNEYAYSSGSGENNKILDLKNNLSMRPHEIALIGCYEELGNLDCAEKILVVAEKSKNKDLQNLVKVQIEAPLKVKKYYDKISTFSEINNSISSSVAKQYEENPYPRWRHINTPTLTKEQQQYSAGKNILVAGCGTGHELINVALFYPNAKILGIDLSVPSLAYGKQKAHELGIKNVEFMQGDILEIEKLNRQFDMITSGGVLHHMEDPMEGWRKLITCLKPDGVMKIALYSEIARQSVVLCREWIEEQGFESTTEGIKEFRRKIISLDDNDKLKHITALRDFYSLSMCRDLVFHVQEHRFTFIQLEKMLDDLDLSLIAIRCKRPNVLKRYLALYPDDPEAKNLHSWHEFEQKNPDAFWGMYPFWSNKKGSKSAGRMPEWVFAQ